MITVESIPQDLICQLCSKPFSDPRILPCLHTYCYQCLNNLIEQNEPPQESIQCPACSRCFAIPVTGANSFLQHAHLAFEVEVTGYMSKFVNSSEVSCNFCANGCTDAAMVFCCTCRKFMCSTAEYCHNRVPALLHHSMVKLNKDSASILPTLIKPMEPVCSQSGHKKLELDFYCKTCGYSICRCCMVAHHRDHSVAELSIFAEASRCAMQGSLHRSQQVFTTLTDAINANIRMVHQLETSKQETEVSIGNAFEQLLVKLEERKKALLSDLEATLLSKTMALTLQKEMLEHLQRDIAHCTQATSHTLQTHTDHELVSLGELMSSELNARLEEVESMSLTPNQRTFFAASMQADSVINEVSKFGTIVELSPSPDKSRCTFKPITMVNTAYHIDVETRTINDKKYPCGGLQVRAELRPKSSKELVASGEVEDHGDGTYAITFLPQTTGLHQLSILMDGELVRSGPCDVEVQGDYTTLRDSEKVLSVGGKALCVAVHTNGDIYVGSDDHRIYTFDRDSLLKGTMGSWGSGDGQFKCPFGISFFKEEAMYVADCANHRVQVLTTGGKFLRKFGEKGQERGQLHNPCGIAVDSKGRAIVSDSGNNRIQIFGEDGSWLLTIDGKESSKHGIVGPRGLALDALGNIHVAVYGSNAIKVFTPDGVYIRRYGGGIRGPTGVTVDELGYCMVCDWGGNCLTVFDPEGHVIHSIGNPCCPCRVALDGRGGVLVANYDYNNVLLFALKL